MDSQSLPEDPFDRTLSRLIGLPGGAHTKPTLVQAIDFYGHTAQFTIQTVRTEEGETVFVTSMSAEKAVRYVLPAKVADVIARQRDTVSTLIRKRIGKERAATLKASGKLRGGFSPEARAKALVTRKRKALKRRELKAQRRNA